MFLPLPNMVCRFWDTTAPTKEGLLWDDKIVSNLHEHVSGGGYLESPVPVSMVRGISKVRAASIVSVRHCYPR